MLIDDSTPTPRWNAGLGVEHDEALGYMSSTKGEMEVIMGYVEEVHSDQATDTLESCYSDTKRLVAMEEGYKVFDEIDANSDGKLTLDEVSSFFERNPQTLERLQGIKNERFDADWVNMIDMLDSDGSKSVDVEEFLDFWVGNNIGSEGEGMEVFKKMDNSGDGELSTNEVKKYLQGNAGLKKKLGDTRKGRLVKEWDAFFTMMADGTSGEFDKTQFASLWSASGLGLNINKQTNEKKNAMRPRPHSARPPSSASSLTPRPPSTPKACYFSSDTYLCRKSASLERPCLASKVNYCKVLQDQKDMLRERDDQISSYKDMLRKVEEYQKISIKILEAHYGALDAGARWNQLKCANKAAKVGKLFRPPILPPLPKPPV